MSVLGIKHNDLVYVYTVKWDSLEIHNSKTIMNNSTCRNWQIRWNGTIPSKLQTIKSDTKWNLQLE